MMSPTGTLKVTTPSDLEVVLTRVFDAPRDLVFDALTKPEILKRWFGPHGWSLVECDVDLIVGGAWHYVLQGPDGRTMGMGGTIQEIVLGERYVYTEAFDDVPGNVAVVTTVLTESEGKTTLTSTVSCDSQEARDSVIDSGMEHGAAETYDRLAALLPSLTELA